MMRLMSLQISLYLLAAVVCLAGVYAQTTEPTYTKYNPCAPVNGTINTGDPFVVGIAYWPGGTVLDWGPAVNDTYGVPGLNPCLGEVNINGSYANYQQILTEKNVYFSTFSVTTDTLAALRSTKVEEDRLFDTAEAVNINDQVLSVIAFRGNIRSEAQYIRSRSATTGGTGVVEKLGLLVTMDMGALVNLEWYNFDGCSKCGGSSSALCIKTPEGSASNQESCAKSLEDEECKCRGAACASNCTTTYMTAFRGSTTSGQPLESAYQMTAAFQFSITNVFGDLFSDLNNDLGNINTGPAGQGVAGGGGAVPSPQPLPSGEQTDATLAAAQSGTLMPPPPEVIIEPPPTEPVVEPVETIVPPVEPVAEPVVDPAAVDPASVFPPVVDPAAGVTPPTEPAGTDVLATDAYQSPPADYNAGGDYQPAADYQPPAGR